MATPALTLDDKITRATKDAADIAGIFAPAAKQAIDAGVAVEPIFLSLAHLITGLFKHHTAPTPVPPVAA
jgi:hypothetical protein